MSDTNEMNPVGEAQQPVAAQQDLTAQIEALKAHNATILGEKKRVQSTVEELQRQIAELQDSTQKAKQAKLQEQGEYSTLWKEATATNATLQEQIAQLQRQLEEKDAAYQQQTIQARAVSAFQQAGVQQSEHMYALLKEKLRLNEEGTVVALDGGVQKPLGEFLNNLRSPDSQFAYMFAGSGARGMGASGSTPSSISGQDNPYVTRNFSRIVELEATNPELAARLKAQAS